MDDYNEAKTLYENRRWTCPDCERKTGKFYTTGNSYTTLNEIVIECQNPDCGGSTFLEYPRRA
jgi:hypothetical protein